MGGLADRVPATDKIVGEDAQLALRVAPQPVWRGATRVRSYKASPGADDAIGPAFKLALYQKGFLPGSARKAFLVLRAQQGGAGCQHLPREGRASGGRAPPQWEAAVGDVTSAEHELLTSLFSIVHRSGE